MKKRNNPKGEARVLRGGSWVSNARLCRSAYLGANHPGKHLEYSGFRLSRGQVKEKG